MERKGWLDSLRDWLLVAAVVVFVLFGWSNKHRVEYVDVLRTDTLVVRDTIRVVEPRYITERIVRYDTVRITDTIGIEIPITQKVYEDSTYKAWVSGYHPRLDSLHLHHREVYYPMTIEKKVKPRIVVSAGVYSGFGTKGADYGLGITVGVPIWSW